MNTLKFKLLAFLLPPLVCVLCCGLWLSYRELREAADSAYDRSLAGAIKAIDTSINTKNGSIDMDLPYKMLEFFQLTAQGEVFYSVTTEDGLVTMGNIDLPASPVKLQSGSPYFYDATYLSMRVRVGAYARPLDKPLYGDRPGRIIIRVAETIEPRSTFIHGLMAKAVLQDVLLMGTIALLMVAGIIIVLQPLRRLSREVERRTEDDLTPISAVSIPCEVRPLADAINHHIHRYRLLASSQRQFLDDASHQLRTPLSILRTQVEYALREPAPPSVKTALDAMRSSLDRSIRLANQMLTLARVNHSASSPERMETVDLGRIAEEAGHALLPESRRKGQDFGLVVANRPIGTVGNKCLLHEAIYNLAENAIRYAPAGGHITLAVSADSEWAIATVSDNGPGMSAEEKARIGERFHRGRTATGKGAGLGLAITKAIAERHGGRLEACDGPGGIGLVFRLLIPLGGRAKPIGSSGPGGQCPVRPIPEVSSLDRRNPMLSHEGNAKRNKPHAVNE